MLSSDFVSTCGIGSAVTIEVDPDSTTVSDITSKKDLYFSSSDVTDVQGMDTTCVVFLVTHGWTGFLAITDRRVAVSLRTILLWQMQLFLL